MKLQSDQIDFEAYLAQTQHSREIFEKSAYSESLDTYIDNPNARKGSHLPWNTSASKVGIRNGEVSLWAGVNGHGKTLAIGQAVLGFVQQQEKVLVCSFEMSPEACLTSMLSQAACNPFLSKSDRDRFFRWKKDHLYLFEKRGKVSPDALLGACKYAADKFGVKHIVIDNLTMVMDSEDDYNTQKHFILQLTELAIDLKVHFHVVVHCRKGKDEYTAPNKFDIKGTGSLIDLAQNIFIIHRNIKKEEEVEAGNPYDYSIPDATFTCVKQRGGDGWLGVIPLWFEKQSKQFLPVSRSAPHQYLKGVV